VYGDGASSAGGAAHRDRDGSAGESPEAAQTKFAAIPPERTGFFGHLPIVGTPDETTPQVQTLVGAGFQYLIFIVWDLETLRLLGERVLPDVTANEHG